MTAVRTYMQSSTGTVHADHITTHLVDQGVITHSNNPKATVVQCLIRLRDRGEIEAHGLNWYQGVRHA